ncbi:MAG: 2-oxoacid:acceptor oxidoreductase subunit alpha [Candidatus Zixiibacteriota bacterium]|nr:MAG: 2-oxoacid:acceptor oxidoreductase subunit alpha [candidate division Zixibacteria bacterium]
MKGTNELSFVVGGFAGQGVNTVGYALARICSRAGLHVFINLEYPSNIKGEHNYAQVMVSEKPIGSHVNSVDLLLALDARSVVLHKDKIKPGGALIYDREGVEVSPVDAGLKVGDIERSDIIVIDMPMAQIAKDAGGSKKMVNSVGLGAVMGSLRFDFELLADMLRQSLEKLDDKVVAANLEGARQAYDIAREKYAEQVGIVLEKCDGPDRMLVTGNQAVALGAIKAGVRFYSAYPMSPSTGVMVYLTKQARDRGIVTIQPEDEISAAGMSIGASFAGVRAMTGTSGGGFCLMSEYFGLAGITEIPLVIFVAQRPGPATGLPTRTEQGDLKFVLSAHQGDFARIVVAPGDVSEAFYLTFDAFNLADKYQTPVILLSDKHLAEATWTQEPLETANMKIDRGDLLRTEELAGMSDYKRYQVTDSGISPRALPGAPGGVFKATGNEHTESGLVSEDADNRASQMDKRQRKTSTLDVSDIGARLHGNPEAKITLVGWGSTKPVILDVITQLKEAHKIDCSFLQVIYMEPFPVDHVSRVLNKAGRTLLIENNATGQLGQLIRQQTGILIKDQILKYNGRQFMRDELADLIGQRLREA